MNAQMQGGYRPQYQAQTRSPAARRPGKKTKEDVQLIVSPTRQAQYQPEYNMANPHLCPIYTRNNALLP